MSEIDPLKQSTDYEVTRGSNFKSPSSDTRSVSIVNGGLTADTSSGYEGYGVAPDVEGDVGDVSAGAAGGGNSGGGSGLSDGPGGLILPSNFTVTFSPAVVTGSDEVVYGSVVTDAQGNQSISVDATCSPVRGALSFEFRLVKIS